MSVSHQTGGSKVSLVVGGGEKRFYRRKHHRKGRRWVFALFLAWLTLLPLMLPRLGAGIPEIGRTFLQHNELSCRATRRIYPYSVIPGGVLSIEEIRRSIHADPVVAQHYADIYVDDLVPRRLDRPIDVYVSYRVNNAVYWSHHTIRLPAGELLWVNDRHMIRARCGNRVAFELPPEAPKTPVPAPPEIVFEYGLPPIFPVASVPIIPKTTLAPRPFFVPVFYCCGGGGGGGGGGSVGPRSIPEPSTLSLLAGSLLVWWAIERRRTKT